MNAVAVMVSKLAHHDAWPLLRRAYRMQRQPQRSQQRVENARAIIELAEIYATDLVGFVNLLNRDELATLSSNVPHRTTGLRELPSNASISDLRAALWQWGAIVEAGVETYIGTSLQPRPYIVAGHVVMHQPARGPSSSNHNWPRPLPASRVAVAIDDEPNTVEELLAAADAAIGVRLGPRGNDKGAWGQRAAELLGVIDRGDDEPDWRGDVEIKTVPVKRDSNGWWRVAEDPAICMAAGRPLAKLQRVLWMVRVTLPDGDATILSWYFLECDPVIHRLAMRDLHQRPKGPRGTKQRGWYLHKRFFADAGLLATLNGSSVQASVGATG
jgi:hypothetical protein